jgi:hypothetical protein
MKWLSRFVWLVAWSVWLWLGFGLYRELPRHAGPVVSRLPLEKEETPVGFVAETKEVLVQQEHLRFGFKVFDARTGSMIRKFQEDERRLLWSVSNCVRHGVVFVHGDDTAGSTRLRQHLLALNPQSGQWTTLAKTPTHSFSVHPVKPWLAYAEDVIKTDLERRAVVVDWMTGAEVFVRPTTQERTYVSHAMFMGESNRLALAVYRSHRERTLHGPVDIEIWRIGPPHELEQVLPLARFGAVIDASASGRIAWGRAGDQGAFDVYDLDAGRMLLAKPPPEERKPLTPRMSFERLALSKSGRIVMGGNPPSLWHVDTGRLLWSQAPDQHSELIESENAFMAVERWNQFEAFKHFKKWNTVALRDLETGRVIHRCWESEASSLKSRSADGMLGVTKEGVVHELPFRVQWTALVLCQTMLALPLVLLWATLRIRKRRAGDVNPPVRPVIATQ